MKRKHLCDGCHKKTLECLRTNPPHYKCPSCGYESRFAKSTETTGFSQKKKGEEQPKGI